MTNFNNNLCYQFLYQYLLLMEIQYSMVISIIILLSIIKLIYAIDPNCVTFVGNFCIACNNKTQLYNGWCWSPDARCQIFAESGCAICKPGFQLVNGWCYSPDPNCYIFSSSRVCLLCNSGYSFYTGWCRQKSSLCTNSSFSLCTACQKGYYIDNGWCYPDSSQDNCQALTYNGCTACNAGYQLVQGICYPLDVNCQSFSNSSSCTACKTGNQLFFGWCFLPDANCKTLKGSLCTACKPGYHLSVTEGFCHLPDPTCLKQSLYGCILCPLGYYITLNGKCDTPYLNCKIFTPSGCNLCIFGYYLSYGYCYSLCQTHDSTGACAKCYSGYNLIGDLCVPNNSTDSCLHFSSKGICHLCPTNYTLYDGQCYVTISNCYVYTQTGSCQACKSGYTGNGSYCAICSSLDQQSGGSCLSVGGGITSININGFFVPCGPGCQVCSSSTESTQVTCITPQKGYYLAGGGPTKCLAQNCLTCVPGTSTCKSCFDGYSLVLGNCVACLDPNAIYCLNTNLNSSVVCFPKYTIVASNTSPLKYCEPCAANCLKCDVSGAGNCDSSQCMLGFVQLTFTLNCTACINSCVVCDSTNPNTCIDCGMSRYSDGKGQCFACSNKCLTCTSATNCSICQLGSSLINAECFSNIGYPCAIMGPMSQCRKCFQGYVLNGSSVCVLARTSNGLYTQCPYGYYLSGYYCLNCSLSNCQACTSNFLCNLCVKGYYLKAGVCLSCQNGCGDCSSAIDCNQAADGFYLQNVEGRSNSGEVAACNSPCQTCEYSPDYCLACIDGYYVTGSACISNSTFTLKIVLGPSNSIASIFSDPDSNDIRLFKSIRSIDRLLNSFCQTLQSSLKVSDSSCKNAFRLTSLTIGSIVMRIQIDENMLRDADATKDSICPKLISGGMGGATVISAIVEGYQYIAPFPQASSSSSSTDSKLSLILGLAIGIGVAAILIIIIVILVIRKRRKQEQDKQIPAFFSQLARSKSSSQTKVETEAVERSPQSRVGPSPFFCQQALDQTDPNQIVKDSPVNLEDLRRIHHTKFLPSSKRKNLIGLKKLKKVQQPSTI